MERKETIKILEGLNFIMTEKEDSIKLSLATATQIADFKKGFEDRNEAMRFMFAFVKKHKKILTRFRDSKVAVVR